MSASLEPVFSAGSSNKKSGESGVRTPRFISGPDRCFSMRRDPEKISETALFCWGVPSRNHGDIGAVQTLGHELDRAGGGGEQGMVPAEPDVFARPELGAALTDQDIASQHLLAAELLDAEALAGGVAPVARGAARFLVRHSESPLGLG